MCSCKSNQPFTKVTFSKAITCSTHMSLLVFYISFFSTHQINELAHVHFSTMSTTISVINLLRGCPSKWHWNIFAWKIIRNIFHWNGNISNNQLVYCSLLSAVGNIICFLLIRSYKCRQRDETCTQKKKCYVYGICCMCYTRRGCVKEWQGEESFRLDFEG